LIHAFKFELVLLASLCISGGGGHHINLRLEEQVPQAAYDGRLGPLPDGKVLRVLSLGFDRLVADLFWLRTVNYMGDERADELGYPAAADLAELVTDIDPEFRTAYSLMNTVLIVLSPQTDAAIALLDKGIRHIDWWKLHFLQGFNYFYEKGDYRRGADHIRLAASKPGSPVYLARLAARLYAGAGDLETALEFVQARLAHADSEGEREGLAQRVRDLRIARDLRDLNTAIEAYVAAHDEAPPDIGALVAARFSRTVSP
jgi:tetratricopeptide (TPR) repeat protein